MSTTSEKTRDARTVLLCSLNAYEGLLEKIIESSTDPEITVRILVKPRYGGNIYDARASELFQPNVVELRAMVQAQITKLRSELQDLI